eukprot:TRINITY_DN31309_c0_g1_i1.p1 TRINITY_DN31309_c0_g1~~TRINITY_DN31309_c0_g1_i1.p1  ORF type:complete len:347 (-),score=29.85 TRINITY_DN31309_c0_g1_i1:404-1306(-)
MAEDMPDVQLLQTGVLTSPHGLDDGGGALVFMHTPTSFGRTIEKVAFAGTNNDATYKLGSAIAALGQTGSYSMLETLKAPGGQLWGGMVPELHQISEVTGCPLFSTPAKHWPTYIAEAYFGNQTIFGGLRDPYERLVAQFRANTKGYAGSYPEFYETCDVNSGVKKMLATYLSGNFYAEGCAFLPQAEFFDPPYEITLPIDIRLFPDSANQIMAKLGQLFHMSTSDVINQDGCNGIWAGDLDCDTKFLIKQVYRRDFELLCKKFGYCDHDVNTCVSAVPNMCPGNITAKRKMASYCGVRT